MGSCSCLRIRLLPLQTLSKHSQAVPFRSQGNEVRAEATEGRICWVAAGRQGALWAGCGNSRTRIRWAGCLCRLIEKGTRARDQMIPQCCSHEDTETCRKECMMPAGNQQLFSPLVGSGAACRALLSFHLDQIHHLLRSSHSSSSREAAPGRLLAAHLAFLNGVAAGWTALLTQALALNPAVHLWPFHQDMCFMGSALRDCPSFVWHPLLEIWGRGRGTRQVI